MEYLGQPQEKFKTVHIAGTSGKTSTCYYTAALLAASGKKVGLTVSPHVTAINERVQINGRPVPEAEFCQALTEFLGIIEKVPIEPSWFEVMVAFAYWYFARQKVDYAVVEVGLGGLLDGTNVIKRADKVCIITDIGFDHMHILGKTLPEIAEQKAGIIHEGNTVLTYRQSPEVMEVIEGYSHSQRADLQVIEPLATYDFWEAMPDYQRRNWSLAFRVYQYLRERDSLTDLSSEALQATLKISVPGRMDILKYGGKIIIMDGAHNAQKMSAFASSFKQLYPGVRPAVLLSLKKGKEAQEVAAILGPLTDRLVITRFSIAQDTPVISIKPEELKKVFAAYMEAVSIEADQSKALQKVLNGPEDVIIITGSLYLLSQVKELF